MAETRPDTAVLARTEGFDQMIRSGTECTYSVLIYLNFYFDRGVYIQNYLINFYKLVNSTINNIKKKTRAEFKNSIVSHDIPCVR